VFQRYEEDSLGAFRLCGFGVAALAAMAVIATMMMAMVHGMVGEILLGSEFRAETGYLPWMILAAGLFACGQGLALGPLMLNRSRKLLIPIVWSTSLGTIATVLLARRYGIPGVILANVIYGLIHLLTMGYLFLVSRAEIKRAP
jgi:O-antigen/teichoic acid export membrane protein